MKVLKKQGVEETYVKVLEDINDESTTTIKLRKVSEKILIKKGVKQGDHISTKVFTVVLEKVFKNSEW